MSRFATRHRSTRQLSVSGRDDPARDLEQSELRSELQAALAELTDLQRRVIVMHDLEGWAHREIADELSISYGSSRVHLHNARRRMRKLLAAEYGRNGHE